MSCVRRRREFWSLPRNVKCYGNARHRPCGLSTPAMRYRVAAERRERRLLCCFSPRLLLSIGAIFLPVSSDSAQLLRSQEFSATAVVGLSIIGASC